MLTYICVTLIEFQAHRDAFIQNIIRLRHASEKNVELDQDLHFQIVPTSLVINNYALLHTAPSTDVINKRHVYIYVADRLMAKSSFV